MEMRSFSSLHGRHCTVSGAQGVQDFVGLAGAAAARSAEWDNRLAGKVIAFEERMDDGRRYIPPDGEADKDCAICVHIRDRSGDRRPRGRILHLDGAAAFFVHPVQIRRRIGGFRQDFIEVCAYGAANGLRCFLVMPRTKISDELFFLPCGVSFPSLLIITILSYSLERAPSPSAFL